MAEPSDYVCANCDETGQRIAALESQLAAAQAEVQRLKKAEEALEHEQSYGVELKRQLAEMPNLREALAAHVQTIREREEQLAKMREALKWVSHNALWASQQSSEESVVSYLIAIMNRAETALDKATAEKEAK